MPAGDAIARITSAQGAITNGGRASRTAIQIPEFFFSDTIDETVYFFVYMAGQYDGIADIRVVLPWKFEVFVGSQTCAWDVSFYRIADNADSAEASSFAAAQSILSTEAGTAGFLRYAPVVFTNAQADGIQPSEMGIVRVVRDAASGTASPGDAGLFLPALELN